ncbi:hypothetical protein [Inquilinus sp. CA228]|uniref:hypothetical protein n=1 Tax=Inquilinus sp. CA228 TaxID=3455609 RepID=UPI003F8CF565
MIRDVLIGRIALATEIPVGTVARVVDSIREIEAEATRSPVDLLFPPPTPAAPFEDLC